MISAQEAERSRIAAELHDSVGPKLAFIAKLSLFVKRFAAKE